ncbi:hypothetical protein DC094_11325 [Pelagibaculum spongiae]|uniref:DUF302 domain-containing protein n=2 Tax=Pelagibaculum spongiae TaxID=2080658 RepID=A0A2V1H0L2_9GAMM|nr:hypothetical protein DC094_11325 [Pelagibaculum spongiae]
MLSPQLSLNHAVSANFSNGQPCNIQFLIARFFIVAILAFFISALFTSASASDFMLHKASPWTVDQTSTKLEKAIKKQGLRLFASIDQQKSAQRIGRHLPPTRLVLFDSLVDNAAVIRCHQSLALELPQKTLVWQDDKGQVWISWKDPALWIDPLSQEQLSKNCLEINGRLTRLFNKLTRQVIEMP